MLNKYQLPNGMNVILAQSKKSPVISAQVWVENGSADELKGEEGVSHFIEHLLFKGTEKYGVGEIANKVESAGGQLNAYTSFDQTVYYMTLSKEYLEDSMDMLSQMIGYPSFDKDEIDNEREVVLEEIKRGMDNPGRIASRSMFESVYKTHSYKKPVIGYDRVVKSISVKKIKQFYQDRYNTKNMFLLIAGDFEKPEAKKLIKKYFGPIEVAKFPKRKRLKEPTQEKARVKIVETEFSNSYCYISWPCVKADSKDVAAIDLLGMVLGFGESSILSSELRNRLGVANSVSCGAYSPKDKGIFPIYSILQSDKIESYFEELIHLLETKLELALSNVEIHKAITALESHEFFAMETVDGLANKFGHYQMSHDDPNFFKTYIKEIRSLSPDDLLKMIKKYLKPERMNISVCTNGDKKEVAKQARKFIKKYEAFHKSLSKIKLEKRKALKRLPAIKTLSKKLKPTKYKITDGVDLVCLQNFETATLSLQLASQGGTRFETDETNGRFNMFADCLMSGNSEMNEKELALELESKAIYISGFSGRNSYGIKLACLSHRFEEGLEHFCNQWFRPVLSDLSISREKKMSLDYLRTKSDRPSQMAYQNLMQSLYPNHAYSLDPLGSEESLDKMTKENCLELHQEFVAKSKTVIVAVGAFDEKALKERIKKEFKEVERNFEGDWLEKKPEILKENKSIRMELPKEQSHIFLGYHGLKLQDKEKYTLKLMESVLSGQGGRLFIELRDKASLAYTVSPIRLEGIETGYFGSYIGCSPEKETKATSMMLEEFDKLVKNPVSEDELNKAKQNLIGKFDIQTQKNSAVASKMLFDELYGMGFDEKDKNTDYIKAVTASEIQALAKKIFSQKYALSVVEGKRPN